MKTATRKPLWAAIALSCLSLWSAAMGQGVGGRGTPNAVPVEDGDLKQRIEQFAALQRSGGLDRLIAEAELKAGGSNASAETHFELGLLLAARAMFGTDVREASQSWERSIEKFEQAIRKSPDFANAHSVLGHLYMCPFVKDEDALSRAEEHFQKALRLKPGEPCAREGMKRLALRSSSRKDRKRHIESQLRQLARVTQSGRSFSVLSVRTEDSPLGRAVLAEISVKAVPDAAIVDTVEQMRRLGRLSDSRGPLATSRQMIASIIRMASEASGVIYSATHALGLDADRVGVVLYGAAANRPLRSVRVPCSLFQKLMQGRRLSEQEMFGGMDCADEVDEEATMRAPTGATRVVRIIDAKGKEIEQAEEHESRQED